MSFWDNVKKFAQPYSDDEYDDYDDELDGYEEEEAPRRSRAAASESTNEAAPAPAAKSGSFSGQVLNMSSGKQEVVLFHAKTFDDAAKAAELKDLYGKILADEEVTTWLNETMLLEVDTMTVADVEAHIENVKGIVNQYKDIVAG